VQSSKIKILKASKFLLIYYVNYSQPQNTIEIEKKTKTLKEKKSKKKLLSSQANFCN
jgi:hypothetical protein